MGGVAVALLSCVLVLVAASCSSVAAQPLSDEPGGLLWVAERQGVLELSADGEPLGELALDGEVHTIALDRPRQRLWVSTSQSLSAYTLAGERQVSLELGSGPATALSIDPRNGNLWLCAAGELWSVSSAGVIFHRFELTATCRALALDVVDGVVWVATENGALGLDAVSAARSSSLPGDGVDDLAADPAGGIWAATRETLFRLDDTGNTLPRLHFDKPLGGRVRIAALEDGVWLAAGPELLRLDRQGQVQARAIPFPRPEGHAGEVLHLVADPQTGTAWASDGAEVVRIDASGNAGPHVAFEPPARIRDLELYSRGEEPEEPVEPGDGSAGEMDRGVLADGGETDPPAITVLEPTEGQTVITGRPRLRFGYSDVGSGVDPSTLAMEIGGVPAALECQAGPAEALCAAADEMANGAINLVVTVEDFAGNVSAPAARQFTVAAPAVPTTTVTGTVRNPDGSPGAGATVWVEQYPNVTVTSASDGSFSLVDLPAPLGTSFDLVARRVDSPQILLGFVDGIVPLAGGVTDAGVVDLRLRCDHFFTAPSWSIDRSDLGFAAAMAAFDEGAGAEIYAGGSFSAGSTGPLDRVAVWRSNRWQTVGGGLRSDGLPAVDELLVWDDGTGPALYAGGEFKSSGAGAGIGNLARWDGELWREVGRGVDGRVNGLAVWDDGTGPALYVSGAFSRVGTRPDWLGQDLSVAANRVARWDGTAWWEVAGGVPSTASNLKLSVLDDGTGEALYAWERVDGDRIWRLDAGSWVELPRPGLGVFEDLLWLVAADDGTGSTLFAGTDELLRQRTVGGWVTILDDLVSSMAAFDDGGGSVLFVMSSFSSLAGSPGTIHLRSWDGSAWSAPLSDSGRPLHVVTGLEPQPVLLRGSVLAKWQNGAWAPYATGVDTEGAVTSVVFADGPSGGGILFAGPERAGGVLLGGGIGMWDGTTVTSTGQGLTGGGSKVLEAHDGVGRRVYGVAEATGEVAEWNGTGWSPIGEPLGVAIHDVDWVDLGNGPRLYAAGEGLYRWNGAFWAPLGGPESIRVIEEWSGQLFAGGDFPSVPGQWGANLGSWDGSSWSALSPPQNGPVWTLLGGGSRLQVGGSFFFISGGVRFYSLAGWTGSSWVRAEDGQCGYLRNRFLPVGIPVTPIRGDIRALLRFEPGLFTPTFLVAGEYATQCRGTGTTGLVLPYTHVNLGGGVEPPIVHALAQGRWHGAPAVAVAGDLGEADGVDAGGLAIWSTSPAWSSCSPAGAPPEITVTSDDATSSPAISLTGFLDEPATLSLDGVEIALAEDLTFSVPVSLAEGSNLFFLEAVDRGGLRSHRVVEVIRDSAAPMVSIVTPADGTTVFTATPKVEVSLADALSGIDPGSFSVAVDGAVQPSSACAVRVDRAVCTVSAPTSGTVALAVGVSDRAGNLASAQSAFTVDLSAGSTATQLVGTVLQPDGQPAAGARVRILGRAGVEGVSAADGTFSVPVAGVLSSEPWTVVAEWFQGSSHFLGTAAGIVPVPGGTTSAGSIQLATGCSPEFSVRRAKAAISQWVRIPPGSWSLQPEAIGAAVEVTKPSKPLV